MFVIVTTDHFGTPLLCPGGDMSVGLVNLVFAGSGVAAQKPMVPLYWQNLEEVSSSGGASDDVSGREPAGQHQRCQRSPQLEGVAEGDQEAGGGDREIVAAGEDVAVSLGSVGGTAARGAAEADLPAEPDGFGSEDPPPTEKQQPIIQVGTHRYGLPSPTVAARRVAEYWRPGAVFYVVTTEHYGTPLFSPDGDMRAGLINLTPAGSASPENQLVPLFWQNTQQAKVSLDLTRMAPSRSGPMRARHSAPALEGVADDEEEEDEEDEGDADDTG